MPATAKLCDVLGTLSKTEAGEVLGNGRGAPTTSGAGACNNDGASNGFPIVSMNWGSMQLRGVGFNVYIFCTTIITIARIELNM